jgi:hypothetical protein
MRRRYKDLPDYSLKRQKYEQVPKREVPYIRIGILLVLAIVLAYQVTHIG